MDLSPPGIPRNPPPPSPDSCPSEFLTLQANSLPGERCPASQQEGLKLEHSSDPSTNVTGKCGLSCPLPPSWGSPHLSLALPLVSLRLQPNPPTEPHEDICHQEDPQPQGAAHLTAGGCPADPTHTVKDSGDHWESIPTSATSLHLWM